MSEDNYAWLYRFGRKVNKEKKGYTNVDSDGIARPTLKIPVDVPKGRRRLTAVYTDETKEIYLPSLARTMLIYGYKCYIHCPTIYQPDNLNSITLKANLFANNRPVPAGSATFKYLYNLVTQGKLEVSGGYVEDEYDIKVRANAFYFCNYEGNERYNVSTGEAEGQIIVYHDGKTPLIVDVAKIMLNENENGKLVARVSLRKHGNVITFPDDIPKSGTITFYIDDQQYGEPVPIDRNGIATIDYQATHSIGVHLITAVYEPDTLEMKLLYQATSGANTLFIGDDHNRPVLTQNGINCGARGEKYVFDFTASRAMTGKVRIYMDGGTIKANETVQNGTITFLGNTQALYEQSIENKTNFKFTLTIPDLAQTYNAVSAWGYSGNHNMIIQYIETNEEEGDMEYWYYWNDFYIQINTEIEIDSPYIDNTDDDGTFTGNNMYVHENDSTVHFKPTTKQIPKSIAIGNPLRIKVNNDGGEDLNVGTVKVTIKTRKKGTWVS